MYQASNDKKTLSKGTLAEKKDVTLILDSEGDVTEIFIWKNL